MKKSKFATLALAVFLTLGGVSAPVFNQAPPKASAAISFAQKDRKIAMTYFAETQLQNPPTVVFDLKSKKALEKLKTATRTPSNVFLHVDDKLNVVDSKGKEIDSFFNIYMNVLTKRTETNNNVIPIVYVETENQADALIEFLSSTRDILDLAVASPNHALVKKVRLEHEKIRGIVVFDKKHEIKDVYEDLVKQIGSNHAYTAVLPASLATRENVTAIHNLFRTAWVYPDSEKKVDIYDAIGTGAYGIVVENYERAYDVLESYDYGVTRMPFINAHRGWLKWESSMGETVENTMSGYRECDDAGTTANETDIMVTKDGEIVVFHDPEYEGGIARTTTYNDEEGVKGVENLTLAELRQYKLNNGEEIPTLEDVCKMMRDENRDYVLLIDSKVTAPETVNKMIGLFEKYEILNRVVVGCPDTTKLAILNQKPEIATFGGDNYKGVDNLAAFLEAYVPLNSIPSMQGGGLEWDIGYTRDRGILKRGWTYALGAGTLVPAVKQGITNMDINDCFYFSDMARFIDGKEVHDDNIKVGDKVALTGVTYKGDAVELEGEIFYYEDRGSYYEVIAKYTNKDEITTYTQKFRITHDEKGCGSAIDVTLPVSVACGAALILTAFVLIKKKSA